jgi:hypothetical protein
VDATVGDAWVLLAVEWANRYGSGSGEGEARDDLAAVVGAADAVNHSMLLREEIDHAVQLLVPAGLLQVTDDRFRTTRRGAVLCEGPEGENAAQTIQRILARLRDLPEPPGGPMDWNLDPSAHEAAERVYRKRFASWLARLEAKDHPQSPGVVT